MIIRRLLASDAEIAHQILTKIKFVEDGTEHLTKTLTADYLRDFSNKTAPRPSDHHRLSDNPAFQAFPEDFQKAFPAKYGQGRNILWWDSATIGFHTPADPAKADRSNSL